MGSGITVQLRKINISLNLICFSIRKRVFGFDNANAFLRRLDKDSMIPILRRNKATIGINCDIEAPLIFHNCNDFINLEIGNNVHVGKNCLFDLRGKIIIEDNVVVAMQTTLITHIDMGFSELNKLYPPSFANILIKKNCYIGANTTILKGVVVNENCIVASGSVLAKNVRSFSVVAGVPAVYSGKLTQATPDEVS